MVKPEIEIRCQRLFGESRVQMKEQVAAESYLELVMDDKNTEDFYYTAGFEEQLVIGHLMSSGTISDINDVKRTEWANERCILQLSKISEEKQKVPKRRLEHVQYNQILEAGEILKRNQPHHKATRGFHAALIMELTTGRWFSCEDIGRHNAVDKVIGYGLLNDFVLSNSMILLTGRLLSNIVQKGVKSGIALIASLTVATERGIQIAKESDTTLLGALSKEGSWLYHEGVTKIRS